MDRSQIEALQIERLNRLLARVYENVPTYRRAFDEAGVAPRVRSLEEFASFPFTVKDDLRAAYPYGMFAVPMRDIVAASRVVRYHRAGHVVGYTAGDLDIWAGLIARAIAAAGGTPDDIVQNAYGYGLFTGGLGFHYGAERLGCATIPISGGNTKRQVQ